MTLGHILLVDGNLPLRHALAEQLAVDDRYAVSVAASPEEAAVWLEAEPADLILLDAGAAPDAPWRPLRDAGLRMPIILLAVAGTPRAPLDPDSGVNEVVVRPFRLAALLGAIETQLRPRPRAGDLPLGPYRFRPADRLLLAEEGARVVRLTEKETAILEYLLDSDDGPVAREALLDEVWGYNPEATTHTLETHIYRLRQKIETDPSRAEILVSEPGGYRLVI